MNLEEYFERIGFHGSYDTPGLATLKLIHQQHVMSIPFDNLGLHSGETLTLDLQVIFDKIVRRRRGGLCAENNLLFGWVLRKMGFNATTLSGRIFVNTLKGYSDAEEHLFIKVDIGGEAYLADVSYGMSLQMWEPLELVSGKLQVQVPGTFRFEEENGVWMLEKIARKPKSHNLQCASKLINKAQTQPLYRFTMGPRSPDDFREIITNPQTNPSSMFQRRSFCSLQTATGFKVLIGWTYNEVTYKPEEGVDVFNTREVPNDEMEQVLREEFSVTLQNKLQPVNRKTYLLL